MDGQSAIKTGEQAGVMAAKQAWLLAILQNRGTELLLGCVLVD